MNVQGNWAAARDLQLKTTAGRRLQLTDLLGGGLELIVTKRYTPPLICRLVREAEDEHKRLIACLASTPRWRLIKRVILSLRINAAYEELRTAYRELVQACD